MALRGPERPRATPSGPEGPRATPCGPERPACFPLKSYASFTSSSEVRLDLEIRGCSGQAGRVLRLLPRTRLPVTPQARRPRPSEEGGAQPAGPPWGDCGGTRAEGAGGAGRGSVREGPAPGRHRQPRRVVPSSLVAPQARPSSSPISTGRSCSRVRG